MSKEIFGGNADKDPSRYAGAKEEKIEIVDPKKELMEKIDELSKKIADSRNFEIFKEATGDEHMGQELGEKMIEIKEMIEKRRIEIGEGNFINDTLGNINTELCGFVGMAFKKKEKKDVEGLKTVENKIKEEVAILDSYTEILLRVENILGEECKKREKNEWGAYDVRGRVEKLWKDNADKICQA